MTRKLSSMKRCGGVQLERQARSVWELTCTQFEQAGGECFQPRMFYRAVVNVEKFCLRGDRVPLRADYRDRMLAALARAKCTLFENLPYFADPGFPNVDFEALATLIVFWSEGPEVTARRSSNYVCEARAGAAHSRAVILDLHREERATVRLIRECERRDRQQRITGEAA